MDVELRKGERSGFFRSWIVLFCFSLGLGWSTECERALRPKEYSKSRTRHNDRILLSGVAVLLLLALVFAVLPRESTHPESDEKPRPTDAPSLESSETKAHPE
jgi:hypothetical protein